MPTLVDIPRELRNKILRLLIEAPAAEPQDPIDADDRQELHDVKLIGQLAGQNIFYSTASTNRARACSLLLVNHQLHEETISMLGLLSSKEFCDLDIMIINDNELWPTYLSGPSLTNRFGTVHATFRIITSSRIPQKGFYGGRGGPCSKKWPMYSILERFLRVGPRGPQKHEHDHYISIKTLEIDVRTPNVPLELLAPKDMPFLTRLRSESGIDYVLHPECVFDLIASGIDFLLSMRYHHTIFGELLYERIGSIKLMLDGEVRFERDLSKELMSVQFKDAVGNVPPGPCPEPFKQWKRKAYNMRIQLGLPVLPFAEDLG